MWLEGENVGKAPSRGLVSHKCARLYCRRIQPLHHTVFLQHTRDRVISLMRNILRSALLTGQRAVSPAGVGGRPPSWLRLAFSHMCCSPDTWHLCHLSAPADALCFLSLPTQPASSGSPLSRELNTTAPPNSDVPLHRDGGTGLIGSPLWSRNRAHFLSAPWVEASTVAGGLVLVGYCSYFVLLHFKP